VAVIRSERGALQIDSIRCTAVVGAAR